MGMRTKTDGGQGSRTHTTAEQQMARPDRVPQGRHVPSRGRTRLRFALIGCVGLACVSLLGWSSPALAASAPVIEGESVSAVAYSIASLNATINPGEAETTYHFEYGPNTSYGKSVPVPDAKIAAGSANVNVTEYLEGLQPDTTYHYRVVATNAEGSADGADHVLRTYAEPSSAADSCSNAIIRSAQFSSYLPDCRAYELVSPPDKNGANIAADTSLDQSAVNGDAIKYYSTAAFGDAVGISARGAEYVSQRAETGWSTHSINPEQDSPATSLFAPAEYQALSPDLTKGVYYARTPVLSGFPNVEHVSNLYLRTDVLSAGPGSYELLSDSSSPLPPELKSFGQFISFAGASADWKHIIFESVNNLTSNAPPQPEACTEERTAAYGGCEPRIYEWFDGTVQLVSILPNKEPTTAMVGAGAGADENQNKGTLTQEAVSSDGSRIVFETGPFTAVEWYFGGSPSQGSGLYVRIDGRETVQLNVSERKEADPNGPQPVMFQTATADDSKVFFTTTEALTEDANVQLSEPKLYMYEVNAPAGKHLTLIGPAYTIDGISQSGEYVYFEDNQSLTAGQPPFPELPVASSAPWPGLALYAWHNGALRFITYHQVVGGLTSADKWNNAGGKSFPANFRISADGTTIAFGSQDPTTAEQAGYENPYDANAEEGQKYFSEIYVYKYDSGKLICASCNPSGAPPHSMADFTADGWIDGISAYTLTELEGTNYKTRALSEDGRYVFFDTADALLPQDTNGERDVYEYDTATEQLHLISGGTCTCGATFIDASPNGSDVFFVTPQELVRADYDTNSDVYDARVNGGIMSQNVAPPAPCESDDCQGPAKAAPTYGLPASSTFAGIGNQPPSAAKSSPKPKAKRAKKHKHGKRHKRRHGRHRKGRAGKAGASRSNTSRPIAR